MSSNLRKRKLVLGGDEARKKLIEDDEAPFRRITRSYCKQLKEKQRRGDEAEASESSVIISNSIAVFGETNSNLKKRSEIVKGIEPDDGSRSGISGVDQISTRIQSLCDRKPPSENDVVSFSSIVEESSDAKQRAELKPELSEVLSNNDTVLNFTASNSECVVEQNSRSIKLDSDLVCSEKLSYEDDESEYSSTQLSQQPFVEDSDIDFSDYTPSIFFESGSEFSERSIDDSSPPSRTQSLLMEFRQQFCRLTVPLDSRKCSVVEDVNQSRVSHILN